MEVFDEVELAKFEAGFEVESAEAEEVEVGFAKSQT